MRGWALRAEDDPSPLGAGPLHKSSNASSSAYGLGNEPASLPTLIIIGPCTNPCRFRMRPVRRVTAMTAMTALYATNWPSSLSTRGFDRPRRGPPGVKTRSLHDSSRLCFAPRTANCAEYAHGSLLDFVPPSRNSLVSAWQADARWHRSAIPSHLVGSTPCCGSRARSSPRRSSLGGEARH